MKKLKFLSVISLVVGSQIGAGIFLLPARLAALGPVSLVGWLLSGIGAVLIALVFAQLSRLGPANGGGPPTYIGMAFGQKAAFFASWVYWLISWVGSVAIIIAAAGYFVPMIGESHPYLVLSIEIGVVTLITLVNLNGVRFSGLTEIFFTIMKCLPLLIIPLFGFLDYREEHFTPFIQKDQSIWGVLGISSVLTFWGFIGIETATTTTAVIQNPRKTVPLAVILGTLTVVLIYLFSSFGIMAIVPPEILAISPTPYAEAAKILFGNGWTICVSFFAFMTCLGTLNAWVLTGSQIGLQAAKNRLFPGFLGRTNKAGAPNVCLLIAYVLTIFILIFTLDKNILMQINTIIDISIVIFVFLYLACAIAYLKMMFTSIKNGESAVTQTQYRAFSSLQSRTARISYLQMMLAVSAIIFCCWILISIPLKVLCFSSLFVISGIPLYLWHRRKMSKSSDIIQDANR